MNILVTGAQGFIGQKISNFLFKKKIHIYGIGRKKLSNSHIKKIGFKKIINGQINPKNLTKFSKINFDVIIHCAGKVIGLEPNDDFERNVLTTQYICDFATKQKKRPKFIFLSTVAVYGNSKSSKLSEKTKLNPISNYALNKLLCEKILKFYYQKSNRGVCILRIGSVFGPGLKRQFISDACTKISKNKNKFFGTGNEERDWLFVDDLTHLIYKITKNMKNTYEYYNVGYGKGIKISYVIKKICHLMKININPVFNKIGVDKNPKKLISNIQKLKKYNWKPKTDFDLALKKYVSWFLNEKN
tara:strand:- start:2082 stop:2984 length:903 start_codon:yes stop_codon:yes gene_type:complete